MSCSQVCIALEENYGMRVSPKTISNLVYFREVEAPLVAGRRDIPAEKLADIAKIVRRKGYFKPIRQGV